MKIRVHVLEAQIRNVSFLKTSVIGQTDFIVVRYSAINNDLPITIYFVSKLK
jgi:hypothetical protein